MMPIFNGAGYLGQTLRSIEDQTFKDFEVICADDGSSDESSAIVGEFAGRDPRFRLIRTPRNLGCAARVLSVILAHARGNYLVYSSQDDLFSADWLEKMISRAQETGADAVIPDLEFHYPGASNNRRLIGVRGDRNAVISNREAVELSLDWSIPGNALWRAEVVHRIGYPDIGAWSDEFAARLKFHACNKIAFSEGTFFYRQDNPGAITKKLSIKTLDAPAVNLALAHFLREQDYPVALSASQTMTAMRRLENTYRAMLRNPLPAGRDSEAARERVNSYLETFRAAETRRLLNATSMTLRERLHCEICMNGYAVFRAGCRLLNGWGWLRSHVTCRFLMSNQK